MPKTMPKKIRFILLISLYALLLPSLAVSCLFLARRQEAEETQEALQEVSAKAGGHTFLLLGIDQVSYSSDVILLAHIQSDSRALKLTQIPRDSYAAGYGKINSVFASACSRALEEGCTKKEAYSQGALALSAFLENALGIEIANRAVLTLQDFRTLVDGIGGVPMTLSQDLDYEDPAQNLSIHLKAGEQLLDGKAAEGLVRCRNAYINADYGRMDAQKLFMAAFFKKLKYSTSAADLFGFIRNAHRFICTDITLARSLSVGTAVLRAKGDDLMFVTVKGESVRLGSQLYEVLPKENLEKASLWLEGTFSEENAQKAFCGDDPVVKSLYLSPATSPFAPHYAKELEKQ